MKSPFAKLIECFIFLLILMLAIRKSTCSRDLHAWLWLDGIVQGAEEYGSCKKREKSNIKNSHLNFNSNWCEVQWEPFYHPVIQSFPTQVQWAMSVSGISTSVFLLQCCKFWQMPQRNSLKNDRVCLMPKTAINTVSPTRSLFRSRQWFERELHATS